MPPPNYQDSQYFAASASTVSCFQCLTSDQDSSCRYDHDNKRPRGFGFVTFVNEEGVDAVFTGGSLQTLHDKPIEIKRAVPRDQIATARGRPSFAQTPRLFTTPGQVLPSCLEILNFDGL